MNIKVTYNTSKGLVQYKVPDTDAATIEFDGEVVFKQKATFEGEVEGIEGGGGGEDATFGYLTVTEQAEIDELVVSEISATDIYTNSINAREGMLQTFGPMNLDAPANGSAQTYMFTVPFGGDFGALAVSLNSEISQGTITFKIYREGSPVGPDMVISPSDGSYKIFPLSISMIPGRRYFLMATSDDIGGTTYTSSTLMARVDLGDTPNYSTRLGTTPFGSDYLQSNSAPENGILLTGWFKIPEKISTYPYTRGNMEAMVARFNNWYVRCINGNIGATSSTDCTYNANTMLAVNGSEFEENAESWAGDYSMLFDTNLTDINLVNDWVFCAWQIYNTGTDVVINQWVKYTSRSLQGPYSSTISYATIRQNLVDNNNWSQIHADAFTPQIQPTGFTVGSPHDNCLGNYSNIRIYQTNSVISNETIEDIINLGGENIDNGAWADYTIFWSEDGPSIWDRTGNGRNLQSNGSTYQGVLAYQSD